MKFLRLLRGSKSRQFCVAATDSRTVRSRNTIRLTEEKINKYRVGGYHPVRIGDLFKDGKYQVVSKLGWGLYSTVWLVYDKITKAHVALKILTADTYGSEKDSFEVEILQHIGLTEIEHPGAKHVSGLSDRFLHQGPNDIKPRNILAETSEINEMFSYAPSEVFFDNDSTMLDPPDDFYIKSEPVASQHEDLADPAGFSVRLSDFGTASWYNKHLTEWIQPESLRAPEVILGADWDYSVDIWNLACVIYELLEGKLLFDGCANPRSPYTATAHLAQMQSLLGYMPKQLIARSRQGSRYYDDEGSLLSAPIFPPCSLQMLINRPDLLDKDKQDFVEFIEAMLRLNPDQRLPTENLLKLRWVQYDALSE